MAHKDWCGKPCSDCANPCALDEAMSCSPDCEGLTLEGDQEGLCCFDCDAREDTYSEEDLYPDVALFEYGQLVTVLKEKGLSTGQALTLLDKVDNEIIQAARDAALKKVHELANTAELDILIPVKDRLFVGEVA